MRRALSRSSLQIASACPVHVYILYGFGQGQMTGLWLLQLHIMLSQKGRGRGGGGELLQSATAAYKSYAPARARRSLVRSRSFSSLGFPFRGETSTFFFLLLPCAVSLLCSSVAFCGGGGGLIVPHVLGLIHPEICRMEQDPKSPKTAICTTMENGSKRGQMGSGFKK